MRVLPASVLTALEAGRYCLRTLVRFDLDAGDGGPTGIWDDLYQLTVSSVLYWPAAGRFTVSPVISTGDLSVRNVDVTLSALDAGRVAVILGLQWHQRPVQISIALSAVETPEAFSVYPWFAGAVDLIDQKEKPGGSADLIIRCEGSARELSRKAHRLRTDADQRQIDPNDGFFKHVTSVVTEELYWGRAGNASPAPRVASKGSGATGPI